LALLTAGPQLHYTKKCGILKKLDCPNLTKKFLIDLIKMTRHYLISLLAILVVLQSAIAVADLHNVDKIGSGSSIYDHLHQPVDAQNDHQSATNTSEKPSESLFDCQHCCHCHGSAVPIQAVSPFVVSPSINKHAGYRVKLISGIPPSLFRPPIV